MKFYTSRTDATIARNKIMTNVGWGALSQQDWTMEQIVVAIVEHDPIRYSDLKGWKCSGSKLSRELALQRKNLLFGHTDKDKLSTYKDSRTPFALVRQIHKLNKDLQC